MYVICEGLITYSARNFAQDLKDDHDSFKQCTRHMCNCTLIPVTSTQQCEGFIR